ncbi:SRPBCC family protein [Halobacillus naozhouensis]|uniref:SRPBCC domain-containing protein n=1 Tax=Halobacillus naozhouensis TaxID=554880 RepID=A0ABY8IXZ3_9BACI|nr:SRPBCC domain-containing protein [Halobacillus naozhouensis]WFT74078.1 SRPBCC domain-containing protein [Halobacillus naozhouensis]
MAGNKETSDLKTSVEGRNLVMERTFAAPRELVFKAFSESDQLADWWGPQGWQTENRTFDFKPDGVWHYCMRCVDKEQGDFYGQESWGKAVYKEIDAPEKIVYSDVFADEEGKAVEGMPEVQVTYTFLEQDGQTKLKAQNQFASEETLQAILDMGIVQGFSSQLGKLDNHLKRAE